MSGSPRIPCGDAAKPAPIAHNRTNDAPANALKAVALTTQTMARAVKAAFGADGVTIQQFNEAAGGQVVFHLHVHVMPRHDGVALRPHTGTMEKGEVLAVHAQTIRAALAAL